MKCGQRRNAARVRPEIRNGARSALARSAGMAVRALCEGLECRLLLSKVGPLVDAGDQRWLYLDNQPEHLLRATDEVLVGFQPSSAGRVRRLSEALARPGAALAGYHVLQTFGDRYSVLFERTARGPAPSLDSLEEKISGFPALKHLSPTFFSLPQWSRIIVFESLYVQLRAGVDPAAVFAKGFRSDWSAEGMNTYTATLKRGGAIDALRAAEKLRNQTFVETASADIAADVVLSSTTPNDNLMWGTRTTSNDRWNLERVQLPAAWDKTTGSPDIVIAVLDDGLDHNNPDLGPTTSRTPAKRY